MDFKDLFLTEFKYEAFLTRRMLALIPFEKAAWKPHPKSMDLHELATHLATIPTWVNRIVANDELNLATTSETDFLTTGEASVSPEQASLPTAPTSTGELLALFDGNTARAIEAVEATSNEAFLQNWTMRDGEKVYFTLPRVAAIRNLAQSHTVHHRGHLGVYLRLLDIPLPSVYGSTADVTV